ncbi:family 16 glycosylhydrolase, partial [Bacteroidota bacterium]
MHSLVSVAQPPEPPKGKVWILNPEMSDEFDANSPGDIWKVYDKADSWDRTAAFDKRVHEVLRVVEDGKENFILSMNPMWYEEEDVFSKTGRTYYFAGGGMDTHAMQTYGYFEVRIRPSDFPMGSGVFMHSRGFSDGPCGENYRTELDIIENMGYTGPGASDFWNNKMHVNTHVKKTDANCGSLPSLSSGGEKPLNNPLGFNVVGAWWKNKDSVDFYLDGEYFKTVEFIEDFYIPMPVILTMETYTWGSDENNADNPKPEEYMFQDTFRTKEQRSVDYDWVRSWKLVDIDTSKYNGSTDSIGFYNKPYSHYQDSILGFNILFSATDSRDIHVSVFDSASVLLGSDTVSVEAGVKSVFASIRLDSILQAHDGYYVLCDIRPTGGDNASVLAYDSAGLVIEIEPAVTRVKPDRFPKQVYPSTTGYIVEVVYEAAKNMEIAVELRNPEGNWIGGGLQQVPDGDGIASIPLTLIEPTTIGTGYFWKSHIRPVGTNWTESIDAINFLPFQVIWEPVNELGILPGSSPILKTSVDVDVDVEYASKEDGDVSLALTDSANSIISDTVVSVSTGTGTLNLVLSFTSEPDPGNDYLLVAGLHPAGKDSIILSDTIKNFVILDVSDSISISDAPLSFPVDTASVSVS